MADESEDVIFENSPLCEHLYGLGLTDFQVQTFNNIDMGSDLNTKGHLRRNNAENSGNRNSKERILNFAKTFIFRCFLSSGVSEEISCYSSCVAFIRSSGFLTDDDLALLYRYEQCTNTELDIDYFNSSKCNIEEKEDNFTKTNGFGLLNLVTSRFMIGFVFLIAIIIGLLFNTEFQILSYIFLSVLMVSLVLHFFFKTNKAILKKHNAFLVKYIKFSQKFLGLIRKVILFIQEKEMLARGHIIVNTPGPFRGLEAQIKQCMMLRKCLFTEMTNFLDLLHNNMKGISSKMFHNAEYRDLNWLQRELRKLREKCLIDNKSNFPENECSLVTLKETFAAVGRTQSSLLCFTAIHLMTEVVNLQQLRRKEDFSPFHTCLNDLLTEGNKCYDSLSECYKFHKVEIPEHVFGTNRADMPSNSNLYSRFMLTVRSMTIHLQQVCKMSIEIEYKVDELITASPEIVALEEINKQMLLIGQEIDKVNVCYEASQSRLEEISSSSSEKKLTGNNVESKAIQSFMQQDDDNVQVLNYDKDAVPGPDQIFEGETTSENDSETQYSPRLGRDEFRRETKMREESRHLLKELKYVLSTKDEEKMVAIPKMLLKKFDSDGCSRSVVENDLEDHEVDESNNVVVVDKTRPLQQGKIDQKHALNLISDNINVQAVNQENTIPICEREKEAAYNHLNEGRDDDILQKSYTSPFASMVAAAASARNKRFGVLEQYYEMEAEETFNDNSDTD